MKFKYHLIRFLLIFVALFIPSAISTAASMSGYSLGGLGTLIVYAPFFYFIRCVYIGKVGPKLPPKPKEDDSIPITPEMLAVVASDDAPKTEEPMTHEERLKDIDTCLQKAISDCAQGKISAKEFADICALLRQIENEPSISAQGTDKNSQQTPVGEMYPIEDDNELRAQTPTNRFVTHNTADLDMLHISPDVYAQAVREKLNLDPYDPEYHKGARNPYTNAIVTCEEDYIEYVKSFVLDRLTAEKRALGHSGLDQKQQQDPPTSVEKPIGCIPNSSYVPIPWYRNTKILARLALGLIVAVLICSVIFAVVPGLPDPTAAVSSPPAANSVLSPAATITPPSASSPVQTLPSPIPHPVSGNLFFENIYAGDRIAPFTVDASGQPSGVGFFVKLRFPKTKTPVLTFFVRGGSKVDIDVPLGLFELVYASGTDWYGGEYLFGPDTQYFLADEQFDFYEEDGYVNGWTVTLSKQYYGNLDIDEISADQF